VKGFLLDENLPSRLRFRPSWPTCHSKDIGKNPSDGDLWEYARMNDPVIVTKDADFSERILVSAPPPRWFIYVLEIFVVKISMLF
jgi:predicted nuclease of predicted toxin-antitoxin system